MSRLAVTIIGSGAWGSAFGGAIADSCALVFWDRNLVAAQAAADRMPSAIAMSELADAVADAELVIIAVSSGAFADILQRTAAATTSPVLWLTKGFDPDTGLPLCAVAKNLLGAQAVYAATSGPSFAQEVEAGLPTALALAANQRRHGEWMQSVLHRPRLRLYLEDDMIGVCVAGAVKNIIAIAAGIADAMRLGENARAALITRGLAEMAALCRAFGGRRETLLGFAGVGDLVLTCSSDLSRNRRFGLALGAHPDKTHTTAEIADLLSETCEGAAAIKPVMASLDRFALEAPIIRAVAAILAGQTSPVAALSALLSRPPRRADDAADLLW